MLPTSKLIKMIDYLKGIFADAKQTPSLMRWLSFLIVLTALIYPFTVSDLSPTHAALITSMLTIGVGGKAVQKHLERK